MIFRALVGALGKAGTGKTTKTYELARRCRRLLVADTEGSWPVAAGDVVVYGAPALFAALAGCDQDRRRPFRVIYRDVADRMAHAAGLAALGTQQCTLYVDELAWLCTAQYAPPPLRNLVQFGRPRRINLLYTTREPQEIHNLFVTQATNLFLFRIEPGLGLTRVKGWWPALAPVLPTLREYPGPGAPAEFRTLGNPAALALLGREGLDTFREPIVSSRRRSPRRDA